MWFTIDTAPDIAEFSTMLEAIGFTISAATEISNQEGINQFSELKALSDNGHRMRQAEHLIATVHKQSGGQDGHVINGRAQEWYNLGFYYVCLCNKTSREPSLAATTTTGLRAL